MMADEPSTRPEEEAGADEAAADSGEATDGPGKEAAADSGEAADGLDEEAAKDSGGATDGPEKEAAADPGGASEKPEAKGDDDGDDEEEQEPEPDPETCQALALCFDHFDEALFDGEFDDGKYLFYLEPAGVTQARLRCERCPEGEEQRAGLLMTRTAWLTKTLFLSDGKNPDRYELTFPKEFGYVKSVSHYRPESRKSAKYPWSKKY